MEETKKSRQSRQATQCKSRLYTQGTIKLLDDALNGKKDDPVRNPVEPLLEPINDGPEHVPNFAHHYCFPHVCVSLVVFSRWVAYADSE